MTANLFVTCFWKSSSIELGRFFVPTYNLFQYFSLFVDSFNIKKVFNIQKLFVILKIFFNQKLFVTQKLFVNKKIQKLNSVFDLRLAIRFKIGLGENSLFTTP